MRFTRPAAALGTAVLLAAGLAACGSSNEAGPTAVPLSVTPTACSNWADSERSRVTAVQPSDRILT